MKSKNLMKTSSILMLFLVGFMDNFGLSNAVVDPIMEVVGGIV